MHSLLKVPLSFGQKKIQPQLIGNSIRKLGFLYSHALDLIRCMHLFLGLSRSNVVKNNSFKNHYKIKTQRNSAHTRICTFPNQFFAVKNMLRKTRESLLMLLPTYTSPSIPVCMACAHYVRFPCTWPMHIAWDSCARGLCSSGEVLVHASCAILVHFLYTQDFPPDDSFLYLGIEIVEISRVEARVFSLD